MKQPWDLGADTLVVTGCSTSGCVRGSVMDGFAYNFKCATTAEVVEMLRPLGKAAAA
jgi:maleamate amidohydrolase